MSNIKTASLVLVGSQSNSATQNNTINTWTNINLRKILGDDMYDKYDNFNLILTNISQQSTGGVFYTQGIAAATADDANLLITVKGLSWLHNSFVVLTQDDTTSCVMGCYTVPFIIATGGPIYGLPNSRDYPGTNVHTFSKTPTTDITIQYKRSVPNVGAAYSYDCGLGAPNGISVNFPNMVFTFDIIGCDLSTKGRYLELEKHSSVPLGNFR